MTSGRDVLGATGDAAAAVARPQLAERVDLHPEPTQGWLDHYHYRGQRLPPVARRLLVSAPFQAFASIRRWR